MSVLLGHMTVTETAMPLAKIRMAVSLAYVQKGLMAMAHFVQVHRCIESVSVYSVNRPFL